MNLRLSITAVTPLFTSIQHALKVDSSLTALLVTIPLLCFAIGAIITPWLNKIMSLKLLLLISTGLLTIANLIRPFNVITLILGTVLVGMAIATLNVLIPIMIAQTSFTSTETTKITSYYSVTMNIGGAICTATAIPLTNIIGWRSVLRSFAIPALITFIIALLFLTTYAPRQSSDTAHEGLLKTFICDKTTQILTIFMGLQSLIYYSLITWLPAIYQSFGASTNEAGILLSVFQFIGIPAALMMNLITSKKHLFYLIGVGYLVGTVTIMIPQIGWWISAITLGLTGSLIFSVALNLISTSSTSITKIANRSALAQSIGYLLAAVGPFALGQLYDAFSNWHIILIILLVLMMLTTILGLKISTQK